MPLNTWIIEATLRAIVNKSISKASNWTFKNASKYEIEYRRCLQPVPNPEEIVSIQYINNNQHLTLSLEADINDF